MTTISPAPTVRAPRAQSQLNVAWGQLRKNRLAMFGGICIILLYLMAVFAPFIAPDGLSTYSTTSITRYHKPTPLHIRDAKTGQWGLYVDKFAQQMNPDTFLQEFRPTGEHCAIRFFVRGDSYRILGIPGNLHLFGTGNPECKVFLWGAEGLGRDLFTRTMYASQISLTIGVLSVLISTVIGLMMGAIAAYFGGWVDNVINRVIEAISAIPSLFLLILLRSLFPPSANPITVLFLLLSMLAFISWGGLARVVRSQLYSVRQQDYVTAATSLGASQNRIMIRHMLPSMTTYLIVTLSLAIPGTILLESGLSFLGIGAVEPYVSWGTLLNQTQDGGIASITDRPWMLIPGFFIVFTVMCYQLLGDGLRDAFDPRKRQ
ncbi:ABC transporter permease [Deinococcus ruber]|uniref:Peptide ABC transporter permease n=1 Tax=Deinococcus ruber TaxID=1848197 RepID=A0A918C0U1_9DEIO|nr:ABC transporter permease [Deinococcus ruber]GGR01116.1 peptide ABC transporter permease [Deinococcus ruber]